MFFALTAAGFWSLAAIGSKMGVRAALPSAVILMALAVHAIAAANLTGSPESVSAKLLIAKYTTEETTALGAIMEAVTHPTAGIGACFAARRAILQRAHRTCWSTVEPGWKDAEDICFGLVSFRAPHSPGVCVPEHDASVKALAQDKTLLADDADTVMAVDLVLVLAIGITVTISVTSSWYAEACEEAFEMGSFNKVTVEKPKAIEAAPAAMAAVDTPPEATAAAESKEAVVRLERTQRHLETLWRPCCSVIAPGQHTSPRLESSRPSRSRHSALQNRGLLATSVCKPSLRRPSRRWHLLLSARMLQSRSFRLL